MPNLLQGVFHRRRFLLRLVVLLGATAYLFVAIYGVGVFLRLKTYIVHQAYQQDYQIMTLMEHNTDRVIEDVRNLSIALYYTVDAQTALHVANDKEFGSLLNRIENVNDMATLNTNIMSVALYNRRMDQVFYGSTGSFFKDAHLLDLLKREPPPPRLVLIPRRLEGSYPVGRSSGQDVLTVFMYDDAIPGGAVGATLVLNVSAKWLYDSIDLLGNRGRSFMVVSKDRTILYDSNEKADRVRMPFVDHELRAMGSETDSISQTIVKSHGKEYLMTLLSLGSADFGLVEVDELRDVKKAYSSILYSLMLLLLLSSPPAVLLILGFSRSLYRPVKLLLQRINAARVTEPVSGDEDEFSYINKVFSDSTKELRTLQHAQNANAHIMREYYMRSIFLESFTIEEEQWRMAQDLCKSVDLDGRLRIALICDRSRSSSNDKPKFGFSRAVGVFADRINQWGEFVETADNELFIVANESHDGPGPHGEVQKRLGELIEMCHHLLGADLMVSLCDSFSDKRAISKFADTCREYGQFSFVFGLNRPITRDLVESHPTRETAVFEESRLSGDVKRLIESGDTSAFRAWLGEKIEVITHQPIRYGRKSAATLSATFVETLDGWERYDVMSPLTDSSRLRIALANARTIDELRETIDDAFAVMMGTKSGEAIKKQRIMVEAAKKIVDQNFSTNGLYLQNIADTLKVSATYLGRIFKSVDGVKISDYIHQVRIERAKNLLLTTDMSISEIAEMVGYGADSTFYRIFKRIYHIAPKEFVLKYSLRQPFMPK